MSTKVYLAVGHGIKSDGVFDPGAVSGSDTEQTSGDVIVAEAARILRTVPDLVILDEANTDDPNYAGTATAANRWGADLTVAVHHDWSGGLDAHAFWYPGSEEGEAASRAILARIGDAGFPLAEGRERGRDLYVLRKTDHPATLVEVGRIGDPAIDTDEERRRMGAAIAAGVADYLGVAIPNPDVDPEPEPDPDAPAEWKYPEHAERLLERGIYSKWTGPGHPVDTDNLSAYLDRTVTHLEAMIDRVDGRLANTEGRLSEVEAIAQANTERLAAMVPPDLEALVEAVTDAVVAEITARLLDDGSD